MNFIEKILKYRDILYIMAAIILTTSLLNKCSSNEKLKNEVDRQNNNITALNETLTSYKDELGRVNAEKHAYQLTQQELIDSIGKISDKNREYITYIKTNMGVKDTIFITPDIDRTDKDSSYVDNGCIVIDTVEHFSNNSFRGITISIPFYIDSLLRVGSSEINLDQNIFVEGWLERDIKTGETFIKLRTDYPNLMFNSGEGIVATNSKEYDISSRKQIGIGIFIGPSIGFGYNPINNNIVPNIGLSVGIGLTLTPKRLQFGN